MRIDIEKKAGKSLKIRNSLKTDWYPKCDTCISHLVLKTDPFPRLHGRGWYTSWNTSHPPRYKWLLVLLNIFTVMHFDQFWSSILKKYFTDVSKCFSFTIYFVELGFSLTPEWFHWFGYHRTLSTLIFQSHQFQHI